MGQSSIRASRRDGVPMRGGDAHLRNDGAGSLRLANPMADEHLSVPIWPGHSIRQG
jgi:hypothetical protein